MISLLKELPHTTSNKRGWPWDEESDWKSDDNQEITHNTKISIITPSLNQGKFLEETIRSILLQNYPNVEYIIVDGGSTDETLLVIQKYSKYITRFISEKDNGVYDAMNKGISLATGELIGILNCGDFYSKNTFKKIVESYEKNKGGDVFFGDLISFSEKNGQPVKDRFKGRLKLTRYMSINHPTCFVTKRIYMRYSYDLSYRIAADYDLFLKLFLSGCKFHYIDDILAYHRFGGVSSNFSAVLEAYKVKKKYLGTFRALFWLLNDTRSFIKVSLNFR